MSVAEWLRVGELSLLGAWLIWSLYRPWGRAGAGVVLAGLVFLLAAAQLVLEAQAATDPFTPLTQMLPVLLQSAYGWLSVAICVLALATVAVVWRVRAATVSVGAVAVLLVVSGVA